MVETRQVQGIPLIGLPTGITSHVTCPPTPQYLDTHNIIHYTFVFFSFRHLAYSDKTDWTEYWQFLGGFCDLAKPGGLNKLEQYLQDRHDTSEKETTSDHTSPQLSSSMEYEHNSQSSNVSGVIEQLNDLTLEETPVRTPQRIFLLGYSLELCLHFFKMSL